jgi:glycine cleavage system transcriptional repressor
MNKVVISILGQDRPGIIAAVSRILFEQGCNIENVNQTILQSEFSGIFIATVPVECGLDCLGDALRQGLKPLGQHVAIKHLEPLKPDPRFINAEPFVLTTRGPDRKGLVATITAVIAKHGVNVTNLRAVFKGGDDPNSNFMIYEVDIPNDTDHRALHADLRETAADLDLEISIQHRKIFETLHRV